MKMKKQKIKKKTKSKTEKNQITASMTFIEVLRKYPETAEVFFKQGMSCVGCPMAMQETIEQGALAHGLDPDKLIKELNKKINQKNKK